MNDNEPLLKEKTDDLIIIDGEEVSLPEVSDKTEDLSKAIVDVDARGEETKDELTSTNNSLEETSNENLEKTVDVAEETKIEISEEHKEENSTLENPIKDEEKKEDTVGETEKEETSTALVKQEDTNKDKKNNSKKEIITTIVCGVIVLLLLGKTIINFYYGFKYKDYVPENEVTEPSNQ